MADLNQPTPQIPQNTPTETSIQHDEVAAIEKELLNEIIARLNQHKMTPEEAQQLAKDFLALLPFHDQKDLLEKLQKLSKKNYAASGIYLHYAQPYEQNERQKKLELMSKHIHAGNIDDALAVAKGDTLHE